MLGEKHCIEYGARVTDLAIVAVRNFGEARSTLFQNLEFGERLNGKAGRSERLDLVTEGSKVGIRETLFLDEKNL